MPDVLAVLRKLAEEPDVSVEELKRFIRCLPQGEIVKKKSTVRRRRAAPRPRIRMHLVE
jgi:hypothetical protein